MSACPFGTPYPVSETFSKIFFLSISFKSSKDTFPDSGVYFTAFDKKFWKTIRNNFLSAEIIGMVLSRFTENTSFFASICGFCSEMTLSAISTILTGSGSILKVPSSRRETSRSALLIQPFVCSLYIFLTGSPSVQD